jgi:hypothetical protein
MVGGPTGQGCAIDGIAVARLTFGTSFRNRDDTERNGKDFDMIRLRYALLIVATAAGTFGCAHLSQWSGAQPGQESGYAHWSIFHCSQCDDFPMPAYGPNYTMMPGSYAGPPSTSEASTRMSTPTSSNAPAVNAESVVTPADERPANPTTDSPLAPPSPPSPPPAGNP